MTTLGIILATASVVCALLGVLYENDLFWIAAVLLAILIWLTSPPVDRGMNESDPTPKIVRLFA